MIRYKLKELISDKEFLEKRRLTIGEISEKTTIHRMTLSKMLNRVGYSCTTDILNKLCIFFECKISDLLEFIPENQNEISNGENKEIEETK